jgi:hypothetical protein
MEKLYFVIDFDLLKAWAKRNLISPVAFSDLLAAGGTKTSNPGSGPTKTDGDMELKTPKATKVAKAKKK